MPRTSNKIRKARIKYLNFLSFRFVLLISGSGVDTGSTLFSGSLIPWLLRILFGSTSFFIIIPFFLFSILFILLSITPPIHLPHYSSLLSSLFFSDYFPYFSHSSIFLPHSISFILAPFPFLPLSPFLLFQPSVKFLLPSLCHSYPFARGQGVIF